MGVPLFGGVVLVTGASSGIGTELARQVAAEARVLVLVARRRDRLEALATELSGAHPALTVDVRTCDLGDPGATQVLAAEVEDAHGGVDVLINNAGMGDCCFFEESEADRLVAMIAVNVVGLTLLTRGLLPGMVARGRGGILNISSGFGLVPMPLFAPYVGTKHYVTGFTESLRSELAGTGVVVSQLCPGPVDTEFEQVAQMPTELPVPGFIQLTAAQCARAGLRGLRQGRAIVVPHPLMWLTVWSSTWLPRPLVRLFQGLVARQLRPRLLSSPAP